MDERKLCPTTVSYWWCHCSQSTINVQLLALVCFIYSQYEGKYYCHTVRLDVKSRQQEISALCAFLLMHWISNYKNSAAWIIVTRVTEDIHCKPHCVSKNDTAVAHYNFNAHQLILVIFGRYVADRVFYQMVICYPLLTNVSALPGETWTWTPKIVSFQSCCILCLKNDTALACYIFDTHRPILIIFL